MLEKFAPDVAGLLERATEEARSFGHLQVGLEHLLLACAASAIKCNGSALLADRGMNYSVLRKRVEHMYGRGLAHHRELPLKPEIELFLQRVLNIVQCPAHNRLGAEDVFNILPKEAMVHALIFIPDPLFWRHDFSSHHLESGTAPDPAIQSVWRAPLVRPYTMPRLFGPQPPKSKRDIDASGPSPESMHHLADSVEPLQPEPISDMLILHPAIPMAAGDFTDAANFAIFFARAEAATFKSGKGKIDSQSLLVGLVAEQGGNAGKLLRKLGITIRRVRDEQFEAPARRLVPAEIQSRTFNGMARRIVRRARKESRASNQSFVTSLHLLWAMVACGPSAGRNLLAFLIDDMAQLEVDLHRLLDPANDEGTIEEMKLNNSLVNVLLSGNYAGDAIGEALYQASLKVPPADAFDLSQLAPAGLDVMLAAFREYSKLRFVNFDCKHILLGILAERRTLAACTLTSLGLTLDRTRRIVGESESLGRVCEPGKVLPHEVAVLLNEALALARLDGADKVAAEHLLWAMAQSDDPQIVVLMDRLGLERETVYDKASDLCHGRVPTFSDVYSDFVNTTPSGVRIFGILCEPGLAAATQIAFDEARDCRLSEIGGEFLLLGLLWVPGHAASALQALGITIDTTRSALREMSVVPGLRAGSAGQRSVGEQGVGKTTNARPEVSWLSSSMQNLFLRPPSHRTLPVNILPPQGFIPFIRTAERLTVDQHLAPVIIYWSRQAVSRLLPPGAEHGRLVNESTFVTYFSDERSSALDEWCFLVESPKLCLVLYGQQAIDAPRLDNYVCTGSTDPAIVRESFDHFLPFWRFLNLKDAMLAEDFRTSMGPGGSEPDYVELLKSAWPVVKTPNEITMQQKGLILPGDAMHEAAFESAVVKAFNKALEVSLQSHKVHVASEHLLEGLIQSENSRFLELLSRLNVTPLAVLEKLRELLD